MKTLIFFKTHFLSKAVISEYKKIKSSLNENEELILFIDNNSKFLSESENANLVQDLEIENTLVKCFISNNFILKNLNLPIDIDECNPKASKVMWYCSDYPFYIIKNYLPEYDFYWSIEYDVFCNGNSYRIFLDKYESDSDLIVSDYRNLNNEFDWHWQYNSDWIYADTPKFGCFFPVVRLSAKAIDFLYNKRIEQGEFYKRFETKVGAYWPFCELFVPTELSNNGFKIQNLDTENLRFAPVYNLSVERIFEDPDFKLYHPVK